MIELARAGADRLDLAIEMVVEIAKLPASHWRSRLLAGAWHRVYVLARHRGDDELAQLARAEVHYHRGRRAAGARGMSTAIATAISRARAHIGEHDKGSMGGSG